MKLTRMSCVALLGATMLAAEGAGYFSGSGRDVRAGSLYRYRLDGGDSFPDPASRFQPEGVHGPSEIVDPGAFTWSDAGWRGPEPSGQVIYELHLGTFTPEGTWAAAARELPELAAAGLTMLELMPVSEFPGRFGWGYYGFSPPSSTACPAPTDFRRFGTRARGRPGLDPRRVYKPRPDGCVLPHYEPEYFTAATSTSVRRAELRWPGSASVREFFIANAIYCIDGSTSRPALHATQRCSRVPRDVLAAVVRPPAPPRAGADLMVAENAP